mgnify:CR=1 FL=1
MRGIASGCTLLALLATSAGAAVDLPREGKYDTTLCFGGALPTMATSETHVSGVLDLYGPMVGNLPGGGLYHLNNIRCTGVWAIINGVYTENGYCETADPDGDKQFGQYANDGKGGKWKVLAGTGKYAGMTASGVYGPVGQMAGRGDGTLVNCNRATGSYRLK